MSKIRYFELAVVAFVGFGLSVALWLLTSTRAEVAVAAPRPHVKVPLAVPAAEVVIPLAPLEVTPDLADAGQEKIDRRMHALAAALGKMWTRDPEQLVQVIDDASRSATTSPPVTLLLAIAHAETNGKILDVSEAGAVGLAQATPVAFLLEELTGPLFVTNDYLIGSRAYITKKPLADIDKVLSVALESKKKNANVRAERLLDSAFKLRREGLDELETLRPHATDAFYEKIEAADRHNLVLLRKTGKLLAANDRAGMKKLREQVRDEYKALRTLQLQSWKKYQTELIAKREALILREFGTDSKTIMQTRAYEASEILGDQLDARFSAKKMAAFLVRHLHRKGDEARAIARSGSDVEELTAALYNGGSHNVKRMLAGLIASLPETEKYKKKVPATRRRLDEQILIAEQSGGDVLTEVSR